MEDGEAKAFLTAGNIFAGRREIVSTLIITLVSVLCQGRRSYNLITTYTKDVAAMKEKKVAVMTIRMTEDTRQAIVREAERRDWTPSKTAEKILTAWARQQETIEQEAVDRRQAGKNLEFHNNEIGIIHIK